MPLSVAILASSNDTIRSIASALEHSANLETFAVLAEYDVSVRQLRRADVVLVDHKLPCPLALHVLRVLMILPGDARPVIVNVPQDPALLVRYLEHGAIGYVLDSESSKKLITEIYFAAYGELRLDSWLYKPLLARIRQLHS
jgi:DNA-binding NarL/FixJ family response regulator